MAVADTLVSEKDVVRALSVVRKNWFIPILLLALAYGIGSFYTYRLTSIYAAKTQVLLKSNDQINPGAIISDNSYYGNTSKTYIDNSNEKRIILSYDLIRKAINRLDFDVSYFLVGRVRTEEMFRTAPFIVKVNSISSDLYEQKMEIKFLSSSTFAITYVKNDKNVVVKGAFGKEIVTSDFSLKVTPRGTLNANKSNAMKVTDYLFQVHSTDFLVKNFQANMKVESPDYTNILEISVKDVIPGRAVMFLDTLVQVYVENSILQRLELNQNTLYFIDRQLAEVAGTLNMIEDTLQEFREDEGVFDLEREGEQYFQQYIGYDSRKRSLQMQTASLNDLESYIRDNKDPQFLPPSAYFSYGDPFLDRCVSELYEKQVTYVDFQSRGTEENPEVILLKQSIDRLKNDMLVYISNNRSAIGNSIRNVNKQIDTAQSNIQTLPLKQRGLINITRKLKVNENMYLFLLQRKANTVIARASILPETKVIEKARSQGVVEPNRQNILYYFLAVALLLSALIITTRVLLFERIESSEELRTMTGLPIAGEVPLYKSPDEL
ncbi:MAG: hypothetical protein RL007_2820, partial [Bacteroidota bacterium]